MVKRLVIILFVLSVAVPSMGADFYFFGMNSKWVEKAHWGQVMLGVVASPVVHELGHIIVMETKGIDYEFTSPTKFTFYTDDDSDARMVARSGFIAQHAVNLLLTSLNRDSDFTRGYTISTALLQLSYPMRAGGDLTTMDDRGGDGDATWMFFNGITLHNIFRIEW